jgi:hypothetical protein
LLDTTMTTNNPIANNHKNNNNINKRKLASTNIDPTNMAQPNVVQPGMPQAVMTQPGIAPSNIAPVHTAPGTMASTNMDPNRLAPASMVPTRLPPATMAHTSLPPANMAPTAVAPANVAPTNIQSSYNHHNLHLNANNTIHQMPAVQQSVTHESTAVNNQNYLNIDHVSHFFSIPKDPNFPSIVERSSEQDLSRIPGASSMISMMIESMNRLSGIIYPANPKRLCTDAARAYVPDNSNNHQASSSNPNTNKFTQSQKALSMAVSMCQMIKKLPKNSPKSEALLSCLCQTFTQVELYDLFHLTPQEIEQKENSFRTPSLSDNQNNQHPHNNSNNLQNSNGMNLVPKKKKGKKSSIPHQVLFHLTVLFRSDVTITTKAMLPKLKHICDQNRTPWLQGYTEQQLHTKFNSMKHKYKKTNEMPELPKPDNR